MNRLLFTILPLFLLLGCSQEDPSTDQSDQTLPPAVTSGVWYKPDTNTSWQWQLQGPINTSYAVELYDIDLFDTNTSTIKKLQSQGKKVICYFSAGSYEEWRSDAAAFTESVKGDPLDGWAGERWLDITSDTLKPIMRARLDLAESKGCDGVEPDNMDNYTNTTGFALSAQDQLAYNIFIANEAHLRHLSVGLKNDLDQIITLEPYFDFSINEQCHQYSECDTLLPFITAGKPVFNAEYSTDYVNNTNGARDTLCSKAATLGLQTLTLPLLLDDSFRYACP